MVVPCGDTALLATGVSTGIGTIALSAGADSILVSGRTDMATTVAEVRVFDTAAMLISGPTTLNNMMWTDVSVTRMMGQSRIGSIQLIVTSTMGTGMAALDDLSYLTTGTPPAPGAPLP